MNLTALPGVILDGKYRIEQQLGQGGMGAVFVATHLGTTRTVAVKVIVPQLAAQDEFLLRFQREAEAAGRLRHPNVVNVTDFGITSLGADQLAYLVMEFLDGETLAGFLKKNPHPPLDVMLDIVDQIALGLDVAHDAGIVHRDLKPDNIWLESNLRGGYNIKVLDFGIAKLNNQTTLPSIVVPPSQLVAPELETLAIAAPASKNTSEAETIVTSPDLNSQAGSLRFTASTLQTTVGSVLGTPAFMAPEQCQGAVVEHQADIYSLAVITYQLFCGRLPFEAKNLRDLLEQQINATPPAPRKLDASIAPGVSDAILTGLSKDPLRRQPSAGTFAAQLRAGAVGETSFLANGKIFANNYLTCFGTLLAVFLLFFIPLNATLLFVLAVIAKTKAVPVALPLITFHLLSFVLLVFLSQVYKAAATMVFEDAAASGYFRLNLGAILGRIWKGLPQMLAMYARTASRLSWNSFLEAALWPSVWVTEGLTGKAALERSRQLASTQPRASLALVARQYGLMLMATLASPTLMVSITGGFDEYPTFLLSHTGFAWFLILYPVGLSAMFLGFGPAFDFLYRSARRCLGETFAWSLPSGRDKRKGSAAAVRPATIVWLIPSVVMAAILFYNAIPRSRVGIALVDAAADGRRLAVLKAINAGAPVDFRDARDRTPLMQAIIHGDADAVRQLLARGADVNARMSNGSTALIVALTSGHPELVELLLNYRPDVKIANSDGRTALTFAAMHGHTAICRALLARGAEKSRRDDYGKSALDYAREEGYQEVISIL